MLLPKRLWNESRSSINIVPTHVGLFLKHALDKVRQSARLFNTIADSFELTRFNA